MWLQWLTKRYSGLQGVTGGYEGLQGVTGGCKGLQRLTMGYRGLQGVTEGYRGLQALTGVCERKNEYELSLENSTTILTRNPTRDPYLAIWYFFRNIFVVL